MNLEDLNWIAGFYEGEGSIGCYERISKVNNKIYKSYIFRAYICQTNYKIIQWIKDTIGFGCISQRTRNGALGKKPLWEITFSNNEGIKFIQLIYPFLRTEHKKEQMKKSLDLRNKLRKRKEAKGK